MLRFLTYLVPTTLYRRVTDDLAAQLGMPVTLAVDHRTSGPLPAAENPFSDGRADVGFICGESYLLRPKRVALLGVAPVYDDPRNGGAPVYFSELVVAAGSPFSSGDLGGARFVYNDLASLSGWTSLLDHLARSGLTTDIFASVLASGSHAASIAMIARGEADVAAVDSVVLRRADPGLRRKLAVIATLGPYPAQPAVVRADLDGGLPERIRDALLGAHTRRQDALMRCGLRRFAPVDESAYLEVADRLRSARAAFRPPARARG